MRNFDNLDNMTPDEIKARYSTRQNGWQRQDFTLYHKVSLVNDSTAKSVFFNVNRNDSGGLPVTNAEETGKMPRDQALLIMAIGMHVKPGGSPAVIGAQAATNRINDLVYIGDRGYFKLTTGSGKNIAHEGGPVRNYPSLSGTGGSLMIADQSTVANDKQSRVDNPMLGGRPFDLMRPIFIAPGETYGAEIDWNAALALPSDADAELWLQLRGIRWVQLTK